MSGQNHKQCSTDISVDGCSVSKILCRTCRVIQTEVKNVYPDEQGIQLTAGSEEPPKDLLHDIQTSADPSHEACNSKKTLPRLLLSGVGFSLSAHAS